MGRKPSALILQYFERGAKLQDKSNRYPHTCKLCGEFFERGRREALTNHITKKCPAISETEKIQACLTLNGIQDKAFVAPHLPSDVPTNGGPDIGHPSPGQTRWSALEALAEASRRAHVSETGGNREQGHDGVVANPATPGAAGYGIGHFEVQRLSLDNPPASYDEQTPQAGPESIPNQSTAPGDSQVIDLADDIGDLQTLVHHSESTSDASNLSVATAAAAAAAAAAIANVQVNPAFVDPRLNSKETPSAPASIPTTGQAPTVIVPARSDPARPWGEMTYVSLNHRTGRAQPDSRRPKHGVRMDTTSSTLNSRSKHARAKFNPLRRREVQEVRKMGACSRCRILRKTCDKGNPCSACEKVISPRVWNAGCIRDKLGDHVQLYSAGAQIVLSQKRCQELREQLSPINNGAVVEICHFPEAGFSIITPVLEFVSNAKPNPEASSGGETSYKPIMIDVEDDNLPQKVEIYMRQVLPVLVEHDPSHFARVLLETATQEHARLIQANIMPEDKVLPMALELWGLVEIIDRDHGWQINVMNRMAEGQVEQITPQSPSMENAPIDVYSIMTQQLSAAAERKASTISKALLDKMNRDLHDSKVKLGFHTFVSALVLLNCIEKTSWTFLAWETDTIRPHWPLEKEPRSYTEDLSCVAENLKTLLVMRKVLPQTERSADGKIVAVDAPEAFKAFFRKLSLDWDTVQARQQKLEFSQTDTRSTELYYCSHLLLSDLPGQGKAS